MERNILLVKSSNPLAIWGRYGTQISCFRKPGNRAYRVYFWTIVLGPLFFIDSFFAMSPTIYLGALWSIFLWSVWAVVALWLISRIDTYDTVPFGIRVATFSWTATVMLGMVRYLHLIPLPIIDQWASRPVLRGPLTEEALKLCAVMIIAGISPSLMRRPLSALVIGLIAGLGYAFVENYEKSFDLLAFVIYKDTIFTVPVDWVLQRGIAFDPWKHSLYAAVSAIGLYFYFNITKYIRFTRCIVVVLFYLCAVFLHAANNYLVTTDPLFWSPRSPAVISKLCTLGLLSALIVWAVRKEQAWFVQFAHTSKPVLTDTDIRELFTRSYRAEVRSQMHHVAGRKAAKMQRLLQRLQLAYVNALDEEPQKTVNPDIVLLKARIMDVRKLLKQE